MGEDRLELTFEPEENLIMGSNIEYNNFIFYHNKKEILKITDDGFYVNGKLTAEDAEIYRAFVEWLSDNRIDKGLKPIKSKIPKEKSTFSRYDALKRQKSEK